jgi:cytochrome oxidase assembly protein ShyY1
MMGSTLARTAALYVAGGPGGFMAQQAATRGILERADYGELAKKYDPLDPVGLGLSALIPLPFAAMGAARNIRGARGAVQDVPGQAPRSDQEGGNAEVAPAQTGAPEAPMTSEAIDAAMVHNLTLARSATEAMRPVVEAEAGRPLQSLAEFTAAYKAPKIEIPKAPESNFIAWLRSAGGVDLAEKFDITGEPNAVRANPGGIFRKGGQSTDTLAQGAIELGYLRPGAGAREVVDLIQQQLRGEKVLSFDQQEQAAARSAFEADIQAQLETMQRRLQLLGVDPEQARGDIQAMDAYLRQNESALIAARVAEEADAARAAELPPKPEADVAPQVAEARQALADLQDSGKPIEQFAAERTDLAPDVRNLLIGLYEAGADGARADRMLADYARTVTAQRLRPTADVAADVVEAARTGKTVTAEPAAAAPAAQATPETAAAQMTAERITTHMGYAYQWFGFAVATLLIFIYMSVSRLRPEGAAD